jgi:hypothetical protein
MSDPFADARDAWLFRALAHDKLLASEKAVAAYLALRFNREAGGVAWPSLETIAHDVHIARSTAAKAIDKLRAHGFIEVKSGGGRRSPREGISNRYRMLPSDTSDCNAEKPSDAPDGNSAQPSDTSDCKNELPSEKQGSYRPTHRTQTPDRTPEEERKKDTDSLQLDLEQDRRREVSPPSQPDNTGAHFETFWQAYPKKVDKAKARVAYRRVIRDKKATAEDLLAGAHRIAAEYQRKIELEGPGNAYKFTKNPASWFNAESWNNEPSPTGPAYGAPPGQPDHIAVAGQLAIQAMAKKEGGYVQ